MTPLSKLRLVAYFWLSIFIGLIVAQPAFNPTIQVQAEVVRPAPFDLPQLPPYPVQTIDSNPNFTAASYASIDVTSGEFLLGHNVTDRREMASLTKLMLVKIVRDNCSDDKVITVSENFTTGSVVGLTVGMSLTVQDLLKATLIPSANDAAEALAVGCFGSVSDAVKKMNEQASSWHLKGTHFANPMGLDDPENYSTAHDLAWIAELVTTDPEVAAIVATSSSVITTKDGQQFVLNSTNKLLGSNGINGVKTGTTNEAGQNLIASQLMSGHHIITIVLGSHDRFGETQSLLAEIARVYRWQVEADRGLSPTLRNGNTIK